MKRLLAMGFAILTLVAHGFYIIVHDDGGSYRSYGSSSGGGGFGGFSGGHK